MMRFYVVILSVNPGLTIADVQAALGNDIAWYRVANNVWVLHIRNGKDWIFSRLHHLANPSGSLFIARLQPNDHHGLMPQPFWDWFNHRRALGG